MEQGNQQSNKQATQDSKKRSKEHTNQREASNPTHKAHPQDHKSLYTISKYQHKSMHHLSACSPSHYHIQPQSNLLYHKHNPLGRSMAIVRGRLDMHHTCCMQNHNNNLHSRCTRPQFLACTNFKANNDIYKKN